MFVWRVPHDMTQTMLARLQQQARRSRRRHTHSAPPPSASAGAAVHTHPHTLDTEHTERHENSDYRSVAHACMAGV